MRRAFDAGGLALVPLPLPPPAREAIAAYERLLSGIREVRSAYLVPGLLLGGLEIPTHFLVFGVRDTSEAEGVTRALAAALEGKDWRHERYPSMPSVEGDPFLEAMSQVGIRLGRRRRRLLRQEWQGFDGYIPDVPQPKAEWSRHAARLSDLFEVDSPDGTVPERHMVRVFEPWPEPTRSRLVYPMWTIDVGADGEIDKAVELAEELVAFDAEARLTWVIHPLAAKRWSTDPESPWSRKLRSFGDRHGSTASVVLYDTGEESRRDIQRLHEAGFPVLTPAPGNPYYVEVLRPGGWIAGCVAPVLAGA